MSDILRLALLIKHGGVYMDMGTFLQGSVEWIPNIARIPSRLIFNRFNELPKVLMAFSHYMPNPGFWKINPKTKTKQTWIKLYENSFIAAEKDNPFLNEVFKRYKKALESPWSQIQEQIIKSGVQANQIVYEGMLYLLQMQMMFCVLGEKEQELAKSEDTPWFNSPHYYGIWFIHSNNGPSKFWGYNALENYDFGANIFYSHYSQEYVDGLVGKPAFPFFKMIGHNTREVSNLIRSYKGKEGGVMNAFHPKSSIGTFMEEFGMTI